ncbi:Cof-type HAD-IIB family hydrolase [Listeria aquatica]|uniref:Uncharacterized protein n=1 Tax=Listeria aquatica FSL S10-1188 TaxID=1265818 RepID=W7BBS6_9LIST|nr:Cof-type HAD-IIB family hydrolase [Listeria aquatica]EUJ17368.1 hypothetical protein MAQA_12786 [Listeria aquatica FSL S10-1188]
MIRLVAIDIDGTLLNDQHEITEEVKRAIGEAKKRDIKIVLCTGRPLDGIHQSLAELGLLREGDVAVTMNGAMTLETKTKRVVADQALNKTELEEIFEFCDAHSAHVTYFDAEKMYVPHREISILTARDSLLLNMPLYSQLVSEASEAIRIPKVMLLDEPEKIEEVMVALTGELKERYYIVRSVPYNLEFLHKNVSKGAALQALSEKWEILPSEVMCLGDAENDVSMFEFAGVPVAMGNATEKIKSLARYITKTNNEDGVAHALRTWGF